MNTFVEVINGRVYLTQIADAGAGLPDTLGAWVDVTNVTTQPDRNWLYSNGAFSPPVFRDYALIEDATVKEVINTEWLIADLFASEMTWVEITGLSPKPEVGCQFIDNVFSAPPPPPNPAPQQKQDLMTFANTQISILTDATDPDLVATIDPADTALLLAWRKYRLDLRDVDATVPPVVFPDQPAPAFGQ